MKKKIRCLLLLLGSLGGGCVSTPPLSEVPDPPSSHTLEEIKKAYKEASLSSLEPKD